MQNSALNSTSGGQPRFASTQWGLLLSAGAVDDAGTSEIRCAWENLYRIYCRPVYAFIRRRGHPRPEAQDLTQDFFLRLMESDTLRRADPNKGRFRTFLLSTLGHFLIDAARRAGTRKRGGDRHFVFLDDPDAAEHDYQLAAPASQTPERLFEARWAAALVRATFARLREEMTASDKGKLFEALKDYVTGTEDASYQQTADALGFTLPAFKSVVRRLRVRYGILLREEVARTVADRSDVEAEVSHLRAALRPG